MRQIIENRVIILDSVKSERNLIDHLSKRLARKMVQDTLKKMKIRPVV